MPDELTFSLSVEELDSGPPEERATFGLLAIAANDRLLTAGEDTQMRQLSYGPHVSGYPLAEWLAWNWWRIRWEGERPVNEIGAREWESAHRMATVGDGYAWPDIAIFCDGPHAHLRSRPTPESSAVLFRYFGSAGAERVSAGRLEAAVDDFIAWTVARLDDRGVRDTNLHRVWADLQAERADPELARFRRVEARLGCDPDEVAESVIRRRLADADELGEEALGEVAAAAALSGATAENAMWAADFADAAERYGFDSDPRDGAALADREGLPRWGEAAPWVVGERLARRLREQERLDGQPLGNAQLAAMVGTTNDAISRGYRHFEKMSFALDCPDGVARIALRSKWETGRRFALARLLGDRLLGALTSRTGERLLPATDARTYRQKAQRAFAAELLSPFAAVDDRLDGDYSYDNQREVAERFNVGERAIRTQLVNHGRIAREDAPELVDYGVRDQASPRC